MPESETLSSRLAAGASGTSTHAASNQYRPDIDGLRAIAIFAVVMFHAFPSTVAGGFLGVDVFFVISGYLITGIILRDHEQRNFSFRVFYLRRIRRILPALVAVLSCVLLLGWQTLMPADLRQLGKHVAGATIFVSNFQFWSETDYFDVASDLKPLLHLWSLSIEEQFYIVWPPLLIWLLGRHIGVAKVMVGLTAISCGIYALSATRFPQAAFYLPFGRFWELMAGSLLARMSATFVTRWTHPMLRHHLGAILGAALVAVALVASAGDATPMASRLAITGGTCLLIAAGPASVVARLALQRPLLVGMGILSYPLYLWHWPLLAFLRITEPDGPTPLAKTVVLLLSLGLAAATFHCIERPFRFGRFRRMSAAILPALLLLMGGLGLAAFENDGFASRFPSQIRPYLSSDYDWSEHARVGQCWLGGTQAPDAFDASCSHARVAGRRNVVIWGDSHAGRLSVGLLDVYGASMDIGELARDSCPPILNAGYDICSRSNDYVLSRIGEQQPDVVILFAVWNHYGASFANSQLPEMLGATLAKLQEAGIKNIVVIGPAPQWTIGLPRVLANDWSRSFGLKSLPRFEPNGLTPEAFSFDREMKQYLRSKPVSYVSLIDFLCNHQGCLTMADDGTDGLLTADYGHLTHAGSDYVAKSLPTLAPSLFGP